MSVEASNQALVSRFMEVFSSGDTEALLGMMTEDATWWVAGSLPISGTYDREGFRQLLGGIAENCTGPIVLTPKAFTVQGNRVAVETESMAHTRNGRTYNNHYHFLIEVQGERIHRVREYLDTEHTRAIFLAE